MSDQNGKSVGKVGIIGTAVAAAGIAGHGLMSHVGSFFKAEKGAVKVISHMGGPAALEASQVARSLEKSTAHEAAEGWWHTKAISTAARRSTVALPDSVRIGQKLSSLKFRMPPAVYGHLWQQWQRNHAEIEECHRKLQDSAIPSWERENVEERLVIANQRNDEIKRLMAQYG